MSAIAWLPWSADAFARAGAEGRPVLLSIVTAWCSGSAEMDRTTYADPRVVEIVARRFVPVRVDAERRPDLARRYGLGGWPTTAFLTPDGRILGGGTYVDRDRLAASLDGVFDAFVSGTHARARSVPLTSDPDPPATTDRLVEQVFEAFDGAHGGFGGAPKFPHTAPIRLAIDLLAGQEAPRFREVAITSLDAMGWGALYDERAGGFFRCCGGADWQEPSAEKLLETNAALLALYAHACEALDLARYGERAADVARYVQGSLAEADEGGWAASERERRADHSGTAEASAGSSPVDTRAIDRTMYVDWNAAMVSAALQAGRVLHDPALSEFAIKSLERLMLLCYRPGAGVAHYFDGLPRVQGLLDDQVAAAAANLDAFEATGNIVYRMMAEELALYAVRTLWDDGEGGFFDRAGDERADVGLLREAIKPFAGNCAAAAMLFRLGRASEKDEYATYARRTLSAAAGRAAREGLIAAEYVLALRAAEER